MQLQIVDLVAEDLLCDDTFQDCADTIERVRLSGTNVGRNIGILQSSN